MIGTALLGLIIQTGQTIPGIPPVLVSGNNAQAIIDVSNSIWRSSALFFLVLTIGGIFMSQYKFVAEKTGGPGQYVMRAMTVAISFAGYKIIFAGIMWCGALIAYQIFPLQPNATRNTIVPWLPAGSLSSIMPGGNPTPTANSNTNSGPVPTPTRPPFQQTSNSSVMDMIIWGVSNVIGMTFMATPAVIVTALCNIFFVLAVFLITAFWLTFALILYALGPLMVVAGLIPGYGDKLWGNWIGATIQCSLWQVWMAFCGKLITSSFLMQIQQLNPNNRGPGASGGGELSAAVMDLQQSSYALVFLILYLATPFVANYLFPLSSGGSLGAFLMTTATAGANKVARGVAAVKTGGTSEVAARGVEKGAKETISKTKNNITTGQRAESNIYNSVSNNKTEGGRNSTNNFDSASYDGSSRSSSEEMNRGTSEGQGYTIVKKDNESNRVNMNNSETDMSSSTSTSNGSVSSESSGRAGESGGRKESGEPKYKVSSEKPNSVKFGEYPKPKTGETTFDRRTSAEDEKGQA